MNFVPSGAEQVLLQELLTDKIASGHLRLFTTNHTPLIGDLLTTYTAIEASFGGYASILCNAWGAIFINAANAAETDETVRIFTATGTGLPVTVYGAFYVLSDGTLGWADLFQTPVTLSSAGQSVAYQPVFTLIHT